MNHNDFIRYIHEYNARLIDLASQNGFQLLTATVIKSDDWQSIDWGFSHMDGAEQCESLIALNHYFSDQLLKHGA
jgi:hypothetical protein